MKRNLLSILILALLIVNIALTAVMMLTFNSTFSKTAALVNDIAGVLDLEVNGPVTNYDGSSGEVSLEDTVTYDLPDSMTIPLAVGEDGRNDSFFSGLTILSSVIFLFTGFSLDAYAGIVFSFVVIKSGVDALKNTASDLIGRSGKEELARQLYKEIRATDGVISAIDMMLHDYGPDRYSGSVNIEIDHKRSIGEVYEEIHRLQLRIMEEYHVTMVFGIYAVDEDTSSVVDIRRYIGKFVRVNEHVKSFHALYLSKGTNTLYCDFIVDYALRDWEGLRKSFTDYMKKQYPEYEISLTIETEFV